MIHPEIVFDSVASLYDEIRPRYSSEIIDSLIAFASLPPGAPILEIGAGTGQMTVSLAQRGYRIDAIEPGSQMAALLTKNCESFSNVRVIQSTFENLAPASDLYDLVLSAQAFHWIDPDRGCRKTSEYLKKNASLALIWHLDVSEKSHFYQQSKIIYTKYFRPVYGPEVKPGLVHKVPQYVNAITRTGLFTAPREFHHHWTRIYSGSEYVKLLHTFSDHCALPEPVKTNFFAEMERLIGECGNTIPRQYDTVMITAKKL